MPSASTLKWPARAASRSVFSITPAGCALDRFRNHFRGESGRGIESHVAQSGQVALLADFPGQDFLLRLAQVGFGSKTGFPAHNASSSPMVGQLAHRIGYPTQRMVTRRRTPPPEIEETALICLRAIHAEGDGAMVGSEITGSGARASTLCFKPASVFVAM